MNRLFLQLFLEIIKIECINFKRNLLIVENVKTTGFEQHAEILCNLINSSKKLYEVPVDYNGRSKEEGKKIRFYHIFKVFFVIILKKFS